MVKKKPIIAIMYDFDKTLCTKNMQEYGFIQGVGSTANSFWKECTEFSRKEQMNPILAYMWKMVEACHNKGKSTHRSDFNDLGKNLAYYPGVEEWFDMINLYAKEKGVIIEHYIISSGIKEIIEGSSIGNHFKKIYACEFYYDADGAVCWPKTAVDFTEKTQFIFLINKGVDDITDEKSVNKYIDHEKRRIPFNQMIYIGDGDSDIPCMKLVRLNGGQSIAVYEKDKTKAIQMFKDGRVDFFCRANYTENSELTKIVKLAINKIKAEYELLLKVPDVDEGEVQL